MHRICLIENRLVTLLSCLVLRDLGFDDKHIAQSLRNTSNRFVMNSELNMEKLNELAQQCMCVNLPV